MTCLCGRDEPAEVGGSVRVGDVLGHGLEPWVRTSRVMGFTKPGVRGMRMIVRAYRPGDGRWPSGGWSWQGLAWPWEHEHPVTDPAEVETFEDRGLFAAQGVAAG